MRTCNHCGNARSLFYCERARGLIIKFQFVGQISKQKSLLQRKGALSCALPGAMPPAEVCFLSAARSLRFAKAATPLAPRKRPSPVNLSSANGTPATKRKTTKKAAFRFFDAQKRRPMLCPGGADVFLRGGFCLRCQKFFSTLWNLIAQIASCTASMTSAAPITRMSVMAVEKGLKMISAPIATDMPT